MIEDSGIHLFHEVSPTYIRHRYFVFEECPSDIHLIEIMFEDIHIDNIITCDEPDCRCHDWDSHIETPPTTENKRSAGECDSPKPSVASADRNSVSGNGIAGNGNGCRMMDGEQDGL